MGQVGEPDLALDHALVALWNALELFPDGEPVTGRAAGQVAVDPDPVEGRERALLGVLVGLGKSRRSLRELDRDPVACPLHTMKVGGQGRPVLRKRRSGESIDRCLEQGELAGRVGHALHPTNACSGVNLVNRSKISWSRRGPLTGWVDLPHHLNHAQRRFGASAWGREAKRKGGPRQGSANL